MLNITKGKVTGTAKRLVIYGPEGIGKSTLATRIPNSLVLDYEDGTKEIDCARHLVSDWRNGEAAINSLIANQQGIAAVIIDTADWCERMLIENMLKRSGKSSIEDYGYGKGYTALQEEFSRFLALLDRLIEKGVHVVFVAHSTVKRMSPPDQTDGYDRYELKLTKQVAPLIKEWADAILFVKFKVQIVEGSDGKLKAQGGKDRVMYTTHSPAWDAKNRYGLADELPMAFEHIGHLFGQGAPRVVAPAAPAATVMPAAQPAATEVKPAPDPKPAPKAETPTPKPTTPPTNDNIPGLEEPAIAVPANVSAWLDANATTVNAYLVRVNWLPTGKVWRDLPADKLQLVISKPGHFARAASIPALPAAA
jgi:adenylate kinase family enzyme